MSPVLYWILFCILVSLIVIFISYIILNLVIDNCLTHPDDSEKLNGTEMNENGRLSKYHFEKSDVEDLTRLQGDFKTILPRVSCSNEVETTNIDRLLKRKEYNRLDAVPSLSDINEEDGYRCSIDDHHSTASVYSTITEEKEEELKEKKGISKSVDDLEFCDPEGIDILKDINKIKDEATKVEGELNYFVGSTSDVKFYEINEKFLKLMIALCDVRCETDQLRKKKREILEYIEGCQKKLKEKAN